MPNINNTKIYFLKFSILQILCTVKITKLPENILKIKEFQFIISGTQNFGLTFSFKAACLM